MFTRARAKRLALEHAEAAKSNPPEIDPEGVEALDRLLAYLAIRGVKVHLAHPPFNPIFFDAVKGTAYMDGLEQVKQVTQELAFRHKLDVVGSFDPSALGCTSDMFIDAEHSQASCLTSLLADVSNSIDLPLPHLDGVSDPQLSSRERRSRRVMMATGWLVDETAASPSRLRMLSTSLIQSDNATATDRHLEQQKRPEPFGKAAAQVDQGKRKAR